VLQCRKNGVWAKARFAGRGFQLESGISIAVIDFVQGQDSDESDFQPFRRGKGSQAR